MRFDHFSFGTIRIDGSTCEHDVVIDRGDDVVRIQVLGIGEQGRRFVQFAGALDRDTQRIQAA